MTSRSLRTRAREPRGASRRRRAPDLTDLLTLETLPTPWRGFAAARHWLWHQPATTQAVAQAWIDELARRHPALLTAPLHRREIGASVVVRAAALAPRACRGMHAFTTTSAAPREQVLELLRHLFARYPVPLWTLTTLLSPSSLTSSSSPSSSSWQPSTLLPHVGQGGSFLDAGLPVAVTRSMLKTLASTTTASPRRAIREAQLVAAGVVGAAKDAVARVFVDVDFGRVDEAGVVRFFVFVAAAQKAGTLVDGDASAVAWSGVRLLQQQGAAADFAGRTPASLMEATRVVPHWHVRSLGALPQCGLKADVAGWTITEITSGDALFCEGERMRNCVASYAPRIQQQLVSIFHAAPADGSDHGNVDADSDRGVTVEVNRLTGAGEGLREPRRPPPRAGGAVDVDAAAGPAPRAPVTARRDRCFVFVRRLVAIDNVDDAAPLRRERTLSAAWRWR
jgi:hypothetical protein